jgi:hypothetical protein
LEARRAALWTERDALKAAAPLTTRDLAGLEADIAACLAERRAMCRAHPSEARRVLDSVLVERMAWTPHGARRDAYVSFSAKCSLDRLVTGVLAAGPDGPNETKSATRGGSPAGPPPRRAKRLKLRQVLKSDGSLVSSRPVARECQHAPPPGVIIDTARRPACSEWGWRRHMRP